MSKQSLSLPLSSFTQNLIAVTHKTIITGSALALHCCKAHSKINRKMGNSPPHCKIVTPNNFHLKLCIRDYVGEATHHVNLVLIGTVGASPHIGEIYHFVTFSFD